jgi:hypothetical protein
LDYKYLAEYDIRVLTIFIAQGAPKMQLDYNHDYYERNKNEMLVLRRWQQKLSK